MNLFDSFHDASFRMDRNLGGVTGKKAEDDELFEDPGNWQKLFDHKRSQYYFYNHETEEVEWIKDYKSHPKDRQPPIGAFLLNNVPTRGVLAHEGAGRHGGPNTHRARHICAAL